MSIRRVASVVTTSVLIGCGGGTTPAESPEEPDVFAEPLDPEAEESGFEPAAEPMEEETEEEEEVPVEPEFPEDASVNDAINAVPQGAERINIDPQTLSKPLQDPKLFEPCKVGNQHFKVKIAVWNGRAVGIDVDAKNQQLAGCIKEQIRTIEWDDKVPSLNTVEYAL